MKLIQPSGANQDRDVDRVQEWRIIQPISETDRSDIGLDVPIQIQQKPHRSCLVVLTEDVVEATTTGPTLSATFNSRQEFLRPLPIQDEERFVELPRLGQRGMLQTHLAMFTDLCDTHLAKPADSALAYFGGATESLRQIGVRCTQLQHQITIARHRSRNRKVEVVDRHKDSTAILNNEWIIVAKQLPPELDFAAGFARTDDEWDASALEKVERRLRLSEGIRRMLQNRAIEVGENHIHPLVGYKTPLGRVDSRIQRGHKRLRIQAL